MEIRQFRFHVGLPREVRLLHTTDNHLCLADERDGARKIALAKNRAEAVGASVTASVAVPLSVGSSAVSLTASEDGSALSLGTVACGLPGIAKP